VHFQHRRAKPAGGLEDENTHQAPRSFIPEINTTSESSKMKKGVE
jgi:hypothetical protein